MKPENEKQLTAVEIFANELEKHHVNQDIKNTVAFQQAKAMEKEQLTKAYNANLDFETIQTAEQYYNETYK